MKNTILVYPNGGSAGVGSMDISIPSGTLFDSAGWANDQIGSGWQSSNGSFGELGTWHNLRDESYAERVKFNQDYKAQIASYINRGGSSDDLMKDIEFGLEFKGEIRLIYGFRLLISPGGDTSLGWKLFSINDKEVSLDFPTPWTVNGTVSFQFEGKLSFGVSWGPAYTKVSFDLNKIVDELEKWHNEATSRIYNPYPDFGGSGFNSSQLP